MSLRITAVTCVKNEGPFLLEWIAYNRLIGVMDFLFYSNDCTDGTDELLDALAEDGIVEHHPNPATGDSLQMEALRDAKNRSIVTQADWVWVADVDEFLNIHVGNGTIAELIDACGNPHAISTSFQFFANGGIQSFQDRPVVEQFTRTHNPDFWGASAAHEVKTLIRNDFPLWYLGAHRPFLKEDNLKDPALMWTDGSGRTVPWRFRVAANKDWTRQFPAKGSRRFATLNHYALRALDSYLVKIDRGDVNRKNRSFGTPYWSARNDGDWEEKSILAHLPALKRAVDTLCENAKVRACHARAVDAHQSAAARIMGTLEGAQLRAEILSAPNVSPAEMALCRLIGQEEPA